MASLNRDALALREVPDDFEVPEGLSGVASFHSRREAESAGLALLAMGCAYWLMLHGAVYVLCVVEKNVPAATGELRQWLSLNREEVVEAQPVGEVAFGIRSFVAYSFLLTLVFIFQERYQLVGAGSVDSIAIIEGGQWWRVVTALTLHGDVVHLLSNLVAGIGFVCLVARFFGAPLGWLLVLLSGAAGNALNVWVYYPEAHLSVGASTAVFGALGLLTGVGIWTAWRYPGSRLSLPKWILPLLGGLTLLGLLGVGDGRVDVAAHISGFVCGICLGLLATACQWNAPWGLRQVLGWLALAIVSGAWGWGLVAT